MPTGLDAQLPFFYIMLPSYNRSQRVLQAVRSVIQQDYKNYKLMLFNDGSTESYIEVEQLIHDHPQIDYIQSHNVGINRARNSMLNQIFQFNHFPYAYFFTLSDDDYLTDGALALMAREVRQFYQSWYCFNCISKSKHLFDNVDYHDHRKICYAEFEQNYQGDKHFVFKLKGFERIRYPERYFKNGYEHIVYHQIPAQIQIIPKAVKVIEYLDDGLSMSDLYAQRKSFAVLFKQILAAPLLLVFYREFIQHFKRPKNILISLLSENRYYQLKQKLGLRGKKSAKPHGH